MTQTGDDSIFVAQTDDAERRMVIVAWINPHQEYWKYRLLARTLVICYCLSLTKWRHNHRAETAGFDQLLACRLQAGRLETLWQRYTMFGYQDWRLMKHWQFYCFFPVCGFILNFFHFTVVQVESNFCDITLSPS